MSSNYIIAKGLESADITVAAGAINSTYSLKLVGRGAPGYGVAFAENMIKILNNSASDVNGRPLTPLIGQLWYNHTAKQIMNYVGVGVAGADGNGWTGLASPASSSGGAAPLTVSGGGTGASTAAGARTAIGAVYIGGDTLTGFLNVTVQAGVQATGTNLGTAVALTSSICEVTGATGGSQECVKLPVAAPGRKVIVINQSAVSIKIFPDATGVQIEALGNGNAITLGAGARMQFVATTASKWYTLSAVYE